MLCWYAVCYLRSAQSRTSSKHLFKSITVSVAPIIRRCSGLHLMQSPRAQVRSSVGIFRSRSDQTVFRPHPSPAAHRRVHSGATPGSSADRAGTQACAHQRGVRQLHLHLHLHPVLDVGSAGGRRALPLLRAVLADEGAVLREPTMLRRRRRAAASTRRCRFCHRQVAAAVPAARPGGGRTGR